MRRGVESFFADNDDTIVAYSVRSGFDLLIQALELEPGDEVIFSALNVKGMVRVVRDAGLVPVPVDLDRGSIGPNLEKLQAAITPRSRVFVAAHLFGTRLDLDPLFEFCRNKGIIAVEDCAQAFNGRVYPGSLKADLRFQPPTAMLALLSRRLEEFNIQAIRVRTNKGEKLRDMIGASVAMPAQANTHHDYWVFPLVVDEPRKFIDGLRAEGFDAADLPRSQQIAAPKDRPELEPQIAAGVMRDLVVIPCYDTMPDEELKRQAEVIKRIAREAIPTKA